MAPSLWIALYMLREAFVTRIMVLTSNHVWFSFYIVLEPSCQFPRARTPCVGKITCYQNKYTESILLVTPTQNSNIALWTLFFRLKGPRVTYWRRQNQSHCAELRRGPLSAAIWLRRPEHPRCNMGKKQQPPSHSIDQSTSIPRWIKL